MKFAIYNIDKIYDLNLNQYFENFKGKKAEIRLLNIEFDNPNNLKYPRVYLEFDNFYTDFIEIFLNNFDSEKIMKPNENKRSFILFLDSYMVDFLPKIINNIDSFRIKTNSDMRFNIFFELNIL